MKTSVQRVLAGILLVVYIPLLLKAVLFKHYHGGSFLEGATLEGIRFRLQYAVNFVPFKSILFYLTSGQRGLAIWNLGGNLVLLGPLGFLVPLAFPKRWTIGRIAVLGFLVSLSIEVVQLLTGRGSFDVDDLLLNVAGAVLGWAVYWGRTRLLSRTGAGQTHQA